MPPKSQTPCRYYLHSTCHRGRTCSYLHAPAPTTSSASASASTSTLRPTASPFTPPCRFAAAGYCSRPRCPYTHPPTPPSSPPPPAPTTLTITLQNHTITFGPGLSILSTTPTLPATLHIHNLPDTVTPAALATLLAPYEPSSIRFTATHAAAHIPHPLLPAALKALHASHIDGTRITAVAAPTPGAASDRADTVLITYPSISRAATISLSRDPPRVQQEGTVCGRRVRLHHHAGGMVRVTGLPPTVRPCDVKRGLKLPAGSFVWLAEVPIEYQIDADESSHHIRRLIETGDRVVLSREVVSGEAESDATVKVLLRMGSSESARDVAHELDGNSFKFQGGRPMVGGAKLRAKLLYRSRLRTSRQVWAAVGGELEALQKEVRARFVRVGIFGERAEGEDDGRGHVAVTVSGCDRAAVCDAKRRIAGIMAGELVMSPGGGGVPLWSDRLLTPEGICVLRQIGTEMGAYVHYDVQKRRLAAYGAPAARIAARERLLAHIGALLPPPPPPPQVEEAGEGECPVCLTAPTNPVVIPTCGHAYCADCLSDFFASTPSTRSFPINCIICQSPLPLSVIPASLHTAAWSNHVLTHPAELHFCSTADCTGVLPAKADDEGENILCGECLVEQCTRCGVPSHDGLTCADARELGKWEAERLFGEWAKGRDVKRCTGRGCGAVIEKIDGCNHVQCQRCFVHMCWVCGGLYSRAGVYVHMRAAHGGIGLDFDDDEFEQVPAEWVPAPGGRPGQGHWVGGNDGW